jgi:hypothetical protein
MDWDIFNEESECESKFATPHIFITAIPSASKLIYL